MTAPISETSHPGHDLPDIRLTQLRSHLNDRYHVALADYINPAPWWTMLVERGRSDRDVIAVAAIDPDTGVFRLAAFTATEFYSAACPLPFAKAERDSVERAARWVFQYVPETPAT